MKVFEGVPAPYDTKKKLVIPDALKIVRLKDERKFCALGDLSASVGWKKKNLLDQLEEKRKERAKKYYEKKLEKLNNKRKALALPEIKNIKQQLSAFGY